MLFKAKMLAGFGIVLLLVVGFFLIKYSYIKEEISKRNTVETQVKSRDNCLSTCFAVIKQVTQVTDAARASFEKVYPEIMREGVGKGGNFMKWVQSNAPEFAIGENFDKLTRVIEAQRMDFKNKQDAMLSAAQSYKEFVENPVAQFFTGKQASDAIIPTVIVTETAATTITTGVESDKNLDLELKD